MIHLSANATVPQVSLLDKGIATVIILFILSMIAERFVTWIKLRYGRRGNFFLGLVKEDTDLVTKGRTNQEEAIREQKILGLNISISIIIALVAKADLFAIINSNTPNEVLGWNRNDYSKDPCIPSILLGCLLTGFFISLGSKFWHDLLDMLFEIKNYKRALTDPSTFKVDNVKSLEKILSTFESDFVKLAYNEAKSKYMAMDNVKAISLKQDDLGHYMEVTIQHPDPGIGSAFQYILDDGTPREFRVKIVELGDDELVAYNLDLTDRIFDMLHPANYGTIGCIVKPKNGNSSNRFILTCCHNVVHPITNLPLKDTVNVAGSDGSHTTPLGTVVKTKLDHEIDAALIEITDANAKILNEVPGMGKPNSPRRIFRADVGIVACINGAKTGESDGYIESVYSTAKFNYDQNTKLERELTNLIMISKDGKGISNPGDSGCCVLDDKSNIIGLVIGGGRKATYIMPITILLSKMEVELV